MCLILFAYETHPLYRLILVANRDEFFERPTTPLDQWRDHPQVFAGRDLKDMGTWMGINRRGSLAAITNYRDPACVLPRAPSRGHLVADFLSGSDSALPYLTRIKTRAKFYNGFNLLAGDSRGLFYFSNRDQSGVRRLGPGYFALSNHLLNTPWPKVESGLRQLTAVLEEKNQVQTEKLFDLLKDQTAADDEHLPSTGICLEWERILSPIFIHSPSYGTRSSSLLLVDYYGKMSFYERTWDNEATRPTEVDTRYFEITPDSQGGE